MKVQIEPGKYILAVSGGVDSMVLLDLLAKKPGIELVVAHFNHGIRPQAALDEQFVRQAAKRLGVAFEAGYGHLGERASEAAARETRYRFLYDIQAKHKAKGVITAHHQDDLIETALLNLLRGTGRKGLNAIATNKKVIRPLLRYSKQEITSYARKHQIKWRDDETNSKDVYLRNRLRSHLSNHLTPQLKQELLNNIDKVAKIDSKLDTQIARISQLIYTENQINRGSFALLPIQVADELVVYWFRQNSINDFDKKVVGRVSNSLRTFKANTICPIVGGANLKISQKTARFA